MSKRQRIYSTDEVLEFLDNGNLPDIERGDSVAVEHGDSTQVNSDPFQSAFVDNRNFAVPKPVESTCENDNELVLEQNDVEMKSLLCDTHDMLDFWRNLPTSKDLTENYDHLDQVDMEISLTVAERKDRRRSSK